MTYLLHSFDSKKFLAEFWQKKPCLIKQGLPDFKTPLSPDELAGLALETEIESRIIQGSDKDNNWQLSHGPFNEQDFNQLPATDWTLLVQAVDHWLPEVRELREAFRFIPDWRLDDIMVSYAVSGGSVGAHYDQYDVFLIQGLGRREWQLGQHCTESSPLQKHTDLRLLNQFDTSQRYILEPGDILYLPPGIAHHGIALDECMTYSVGFRAPSHEEIISHFCDFVVQQLDPQQRYSDPDLKLQNSAANLSDEALCRIQNILQQALNKPEQISEWFGRYMTETKHNIEAPEEGQPDLTPGETLYVNDASRLCWRHEGNELLFFADGQYWQFDAEHTECIDQLCLTRQHMIPADQPAAINRLLTEMMQQGSLYQ